MTDKQQAAQADTTPVSALDVPEDLARATDLAIDRKAGAPVMLDLRGMSGATDWFLVVTGNSDTHVRAIADHIIEEMKKAGSSPDHVEGLRAGRWVLIDYIDFVIHVFHPSARDFYQLERLWGDAPTHAIAS